MKAIERKTPPAKAFKILRDRGLFLQAASFIGIRARNTRAEKKNMENI
jgi:hypothetical protein